MTPIDPCNPTPTGIPWLDVALPALGAGYLLLSAIGAVMPDSWPATAVIRRIVADVRGLWTR